MRGLQAAALFFAVVAAVVAGNATADVGRLKLTEVGNSNFPSRSFLLTLPEDTELSAEDINVTENGRKVSDVRIVPARAAEGGRFGLVLVIDASRSMADEPIQKAMEAARAFSAERNPNQSLAVILFNRQASVVLPLTDDAAAIEAALGDVPPLAPGTHMYDALDQALSLISAEKLTSASIVVLSDGADTGSSASLPRVAARAQDAHVRIFAVGLRSPTFKPSTLETLAQAGGGDFIETSSPAQLSGIFTALGSQLAGEYLLRYRSLAGPGLDVSVAVRVEGYDQRALSAYRTPALRATPAQEFHRPASEGFWLSPLAMVAAGLVASAFLAFAVIAAVKRRGPNLVSRMSAYVSVAAPNERVHARLNSSLLAGTERSLGRMGWWKRLELELEIGRVTLRPIHVVLIGVLGTLLLGLVLFAAASPIFVPLAAVVPLAVRGYVRRKASRQRKLFAEQLPDNLQVLGSALRAGHSFVGALSIVVDDSAEPSRSEFQRVVADERLGAALEDVLETVAQRMDSSELEQVALVAALQRVSGGNSAEVMDRVAETVRERAQLRRMVAALTAQGRMARWIVSFLPVGLMVVLTLLNRDYMAPLYTEPVGQAALVVAALMVIAGSLVIKRIVEIKV